MDAEWTRTKRFLHYVLSLRLVIGLSTESTLAAATDGSVRSEITVMNNFTDTSGMISSLKHHETALQLRCAVGTRKEVLDSFLGSRILIERGRSHTWTIHRAHQESKEFIACSLMTSDGKLYSLSFCILGGPKYAGPSQDCLLSEDGLRRSGASELSARWNSNAFAASDQRTTVGGVDPQINVIVITLSNIMQGSNAEFTRVDMQCVAMAKEQKHPLGTVSIFAWQSHQWRLTQRDNEPDTVFCTFFWTDDFNQRYTMDSNIFDSKPRLDALTRDYFVTKEGLAIGQQEIYVAEWTKALAVEST